MHHIDHGVTPRGRFAGWTSWNMESRQCCKRCQGLCFVAAVIWIFLLNTSVCSCSSFLSHPFSIQSWGKSWYPEISWVFKSCDIVLALAVTRKFAVAMWHFDNPGARDVSELRLKPRWKSTTMGSDSWLISPWANGFLASSAEKESDGQWKWDERATSPPLTTFATLASNPLPIVQTCSAANWWIWKFPSTMEYGKPVISGHANMLKVLLWRWRFQVPPSTNMQACAIAHQLPGGASQLQPKHQA